MTLRVLSGIQPTGRFHWGNYFGAIRQYIDLQVGHEAYYFIANLHALTTIRDPETMRQNTIDAASDLLAFGLDPDHAVLFRPVRCTGGLGVMLAVDDRVRRWVCWSVAMPTRRKRPRERPRRRRTVHLPCADGGRHPGLRCESGAGWAKTRCSTSKSAATWPAASIITLATFVLPEAKLLANAAKVPGTDGEKMSKSYNNTIGIFDDPKAIRKQIMRIATDSPADGRCRKSRTADHLFQLFRLFANQDEVTEMAEMYRRGGFGYGEVKKSLADAAERILPRPGRDGNELAADLAKVREILGDGAQRARRKATEVLRRAQDACGVRV